MTRTSVSIAAFAVAVQLIACGGEKVAQIAQYRRLA